MKIDARGYACPHPVIMTKKAISKDQPKDITVYVDNETATENLSKMATQLGYQSDVKSEGKDFIVQLKKTEAQREISPSTKGEYVLVFSGDEMGQGKEDFSRLLMENFIYSLREQESFPKYILCYNQGVSLTTKNIKTISDFKYLEEKGVEILSCGLCLEYYGLKEQLEVGSITNMYRICEIMTTYSVVKP